MNRELYSFLAISLILASSVSFAGQVKNFDDLKEMVSQKEKSGTPFRSIAEFIAELPADLRETFTLLKISDSLQGADWNHPRVLLFNEQMVVAYNGNPEHRGYRQVEVIDFDYKEARYRFNEISEVTGSDGLTRLAPTSPSPQRCLACHGADPKPIWTDYNTWPKAYGGYDDRITTNIHIDSNPYLKEDLTRYPEFLKTKDQSPRYAPLIFPSGAKYPPYGDCANCSVNFRFRPSFLLTKFLLTTNGLRLARIFKNQKRYDELKEYFWLALSIECEDLPPYAETVSRLKQKLNLKEGDAGNKLMPLLLNYWNLKTPDIVMNDPFLPKEARGNSPHNLYFDDGGSLQLSMLGSMLLTEAAQTDPVLLKLLVPRGDTYERRYSEQPLFRVLDETRKGLLRYPYYQAATPFCNELFKRIGAL
jgi:hypothetical protein